MVLFSFPLCIVDCVIFCENSTNWSFFWPPLFFLLLLSPFDWHEQATSGYIYFSFPILLFVYVFPTDWWKKVHIEKQTMRAGTLWKKDESWVVEKKWLIAIKNFDNFLFNILFIFFLFFLFLCNFICLISNFFMVSWTFWHWKCSIMQYYRSIINLY